jgi:hypothetical protein
MNSAIQQLTAFIKRHDGINDKNRLAGLVAQRFDLTRDRSVFYCSDFAIRFSSAAARSFSNTVLSLSNLRKYDDRPFIVCLVTPGENHCILANTTFLKKISHSSQELRENNIRGSFNGSDIVREFEGIENSARNIARLFETHAAIGFEGNLARLVEATNNISPSGAKFRVDAVARTRIVQSPGRARCFVDSSESRVLKEELDERVAEFKNEILIAALIENVNVRGRIIEYLIAGQDDSLRQQLVHALRSANRCIPPFRTGNALGDYRRVFEAFHTETDVKTKIMILNSNPKAYNIDKMLEFLAVDRSVFMFYFVGVDPGKIIDTVLVSMFQTNLLRATIVLRHWCGRNSRGVTQFEGRTINDLIVSPAFDIDEAHAVKFLEEIIAL